MPLTLFCLAIKSSQYRRAQFRVSYVGTHARSTFGQLDLLKHRRASENLTEDIQQVDVAVQ
jgi:hypothetical protein